MTCSQCQERDAVMELTQVANGQVTKIHLCEQCAAERGLENTAAVGKSPLASFELWVTATRAVSNSRDSVANS